MGSIPAASTNNKTSTRQGWGFLLAIGFWNEDAQRVQPNREVVRQRGSAATAAPFSLIRGGEDEGRIIPVAATNNKTSTQQSWGFYWPRILPQTSEVFA